MNNTLLWKQDETTLLLFGSLNSESLLDLWEKRYLFFKYIRTIDVSGLRHIDSTGLAMLVRLKGEFESRTTSLNIEHMSNNFTTLIKLYGLKSLLLS